MQTGMITQSVEVAAISNWLNGASVEALQLPTTIQHDIRTFVSECRHRKLVNNSVADSSTTSSGGSSSSDVVLPTSSVTLKVAQRCATIIKDLVEWYVNDEVNNDILAAFSSSGGAGGAEDTDNNSETSPMATRAGTSVFDEKQNGASSALKGRSIHSYVALAALKQRYIAEQKEFANITAADITATQIVYLVLLVDKVGRKLASATTFRAVASNVTMRAIAIIKRSLEAPNVLVSVNAAVEAIKKRYDLGSLCTSTIALAGAGSIISSAAMMAAANTNNTTTHNNEGPLSSTTEANSCPMSQDHALSLSDDAAMMTSPSPAATAGAGHVGPSATKGGITSAAGSRLGLRGGNLRNASHNSLDHTNATMMHSTATDAYLQDTNRVGQALARVDTQVDLSHFEYDTIDGINSDTASMTNNGDSSPNALVSPNTTGGAANFNDATPNGAAAATTAVDNNDEDIASPTTGFHRQSSYIANLQHQQQTIIANVKHFTSVKDTIVRRAAGRAVDFVRFAEHCIENLDVLLMSLHDMTNSLCKHAAKHIYDGETILTMGCSHSTLAFFVEAARLRTFKLIVLEGPGNNGSTQHLSRVLKRVNPNLDITIQPDSNAFSVMSFCSKVFVSCDSILATGGALCALGTHPVCIAAKMFSTPVIVVAMTVKLIPWLPIDPQCSSLIRISKTANHEEPCTNYQSPSTLLPANIALGTGAFGGGLQGMVGMSVTQPLVTDIDIAYNSVEYVPPSLISLVVTDADEFVGPHIHKYIRELYRIEDSEF